MKDYSQIVTKIVNTPWLILPDSLQVILDILDRRLAGEQLSADEIRVRIQNNGRDRSGYDQFVSGGVGVLPLQGPIFPKANMMTELSGATSLAQFRDDFHTLVNDPNVSSIVLDIDSPGGMSDLVLETGREIREAREVKPIYAVANTLAASAAYWLGSQATQLFMTPSGMVGSLGVYTVHEDHSKELEDKGIKPTFIYSGKYKTEGNPYEPLSDEARQHRQEMVDATYEEFIYEVAEGRGTNVDTVRKNYGEGRLARAETAMRAGMVDAIATLEAVVGSALVSQQPSIPTGYARAFAPSNLNLASVANTSLVGNEWIVPLKAQEEHDIVEQEHSEPGSGTPPEPAKQEKDRGGTENRDRLDSPPEVWPRPVTGTEAQVNEYLISLAESLGIDASAFDTDDTLFAEIKAKYEAELAPLHAAAVEADRTNTFREQFPDEYERMARLEERDRANAAKQFASRYERFTVTDQSGNKVTTTRGFSALVLSKIEDSHNRISERTLTHDDLANLLDSIPNGVVEFGERGSSRSSEDDGSVALDAALTPGAQFASKVRETMEQDNLNYNDAIRVTAQNHPDLYKAYRESIPVVSSRREG